MSPVSRSARVQVVEHAVHEFGLLGKPRAHRVDGRERDLRTFVEVDRAELSAEDFLDALFVVQATEPDLGLVRQGQEPLALIEFKGQSREAELDDLRQRNINVEMREKRSRLDRLALWITSHVGTMGFFLVIFAWTVIWLGWNLLAPDRYKFDPPMGFIFWLFLSNLIQILLMPLIMVGQNLLGQHAEARAEHDLEINIKAEQEIEVILHHLEHQNEILITMLSKLGVDVRELMESLAR